MVDHETCKISFKNFKLISILDDGRGRTTGLEVSFKMFTHLLPDRYGNALLVSLTGGVEGCDTTLPPPLVELPAKSWSNLPPMAGPCSGRLAEHWLPLAHSLGSVPHGV